MRWILLALVLLVLAVGIGVVLSRQRRSAQLRSTYGPEYDRTVQDSGRKGDAERELLERKQQHDELQLRPLSEAARQRYLSGWTSAQTHFVDAPAEALTEADRLVTQLMGERGYPTNGFDTQAAMLSVEHAAVLENYRSAHETELSSRQGKATTEQVRNAMLDLRRVFEDLVGRPEGRAAAGERV